MVTDTGKTVENIDEHFKKRAEAYAKYGHLGCTTQQVCPKCGAILYDSPCFHFFTDCPRCGHHEEPSWKKYPLVDVGEWQKRPIFLTTDPDHHFRYQG